MVTERSRLHQTCKSGPSPATINLSVPAASRSRVGHSLQETILCPPCCLNCGWARAATFRCCFNTRLENLQGCDLIMAIQVDAPHSLRPSWLERGPWERRLLIWTCSQSESIGNCMRIVSLSGIFVRSGSEQSEHECPFRRTGTIWSAVLLQDLERSLYSVR